MQKLVAHNKAEFFLKSQPGEGTEVDPAWGPYFQATPQDKATTCGALFQATGQKAFMTVQTATEEISKVLGRDEAEEWRRMQTQQDDAEDKANQMFAASTASKPVGATVTHEMPTPTGGTVTAEHAPPPPAAAPPEAPPSDSSSEDTPLPMTPTTASSIITVNEARVSLGLDPMPEPDGHLSLAAYQAKYSTPIAMAANAALGKTGTSPAGAPPPGPGDGLGPGKAPPPKPPVFGAPPGGPPGAPPPRPPTGAPAGPPGATSAPQPAPARSPVPPVGLPKPPGGGFPPR